jgi:glycosyltransferase 2 family protein
MNDGEKHMLIGDRQHRIRSAQFTRLRDFGAFQQTHSYYQQNFSAGANLQNQSSRASDHQNTLIMALNALWQKIHGKWFNIVFRVAFTLALVFFLCSSLSWSSFLAGLAQARPDMLLIAAVVGGAGVILSAYQWRSLLRSEHISFDLADLVNVYMVGITFNHFLPTGMGGDAVKALYVRHKVSNGAGAVSTVLMCRITGFLAMLLIALPILVFWHDSFALDIVLWFILLCILGVVVLCMAIIIALLIPRVDESIWRWHRILHPVVHIARALRTSIAKPRAMGTAVAYGCAFWLVAILNCYSYATALGLRVPLYFFCIFVPLASLVSTIPFSINGFGLREHALVYAFSTIHVSATTSLLIALFLDVQAFFLALLGAWLYFSMDFRLGSLIKNAYPGEQSPTL